MKELYVFCEGQTEQGFCKRVLQPHFFPQHDGLVHPVRVAHKRRKGVIHRGGVSKYQIIKDDMLRTFRQNQRPRLLFTSMIDLYALPDDFPGKAKNTRNPANARPYVKALESAFERDVGESRFIAYLQLHEFETLLFAAPKSLQVVYPNVGAAVDELERMALQAGDIENINDTPDGTPSKRIIAQIPRYKYEKTTVGPDVAAHIGMETLMSSCAHFREWIYVIVERLALLGVASHATQGR